MSIKSFEKVDVTQISFPDSGFQNQKLPGFEISRTPKSGLLAWGDYFKLIDSLKTSSSAIAFSMDELWDFYPATLGAKKGRSSETIPL